MRREHAPTLVILVSATVAAATAAFLGGPRSGYLLGFAVSVAAALLILWRYRPSTYLRWLFAGLLVAYYVGGTVMVGDDVLAHTSIQSDVFRYDRGLHVVAAMITVFLVADIVSRRHAMRTPLVIVVAVAAGLLVEGVELFNAVAWPRVFTYDIDDSSLDVAGNAVGYVIGVMTLLSARRPFRAHSVVSGR